MKKYGIVFTAFLSIIFLPVFLHAEDLVEPPVNDSQSQQGDFQRDDFSRKHRDRQGAGESRGGRMDEMKMGMMKGGGMGMHQQSIVATSDGGVVLLMGGKLSKYDANLNLVNEIEFKKNNRSNPPAGEDRRLTEEAAQEMSVKEPSESAEAGEGVNKN